MGGQAKVCFELAKYFLKRNWEVHLYAKSVNKQLIKMGSFFHKIPTFVERPYFLKGLIFLFFSTLKLFWKKYDIINVHGLTLFSKHHVNVVHFCVSSYYKNLANTFPEKLKRGFFSLIEKFILRKSFKIIAVSHKVKNELVRHARVRKDKIIVISNGVDISLFKPNFEKFDDLGYREFKIVFAGEIKTNRRGFKYLLDAIKDLKNENFCKFKLYVLGDYKGSPFLNYIKKCSLNDVIVLKGYVSNISEFLKDMDIFVYPTLYDACPLIVFEAMASGLACVVSSPKYCGASEIIEDNKTGLFIYNPHDPKEIKDKLKILMGDINFLKQISQNSYEKIKSYTWEKIGNRYEKVFNSIVNFHF